MVSIPSPQIIVESIKQAESGKGIVVRLYEAGKTGAHARIDFGRAVRKVQECDMLAENGVDLRLKKGAVSLYFRPFEIKTLVIHY